jgi:hypothetical protein
VFRQALRNGKNLTFVGGLQNDPTAVQNQPCHFGSSARVAAPARVSYYLNALLMMISSNDIERQRRPRGADTTRQVDRGHHDSRPNAHVVVATIIPITNYGTKPKMQTYHPAFPACSKPRVIFLDKRGGVLEGPNHRTTWMADYLHPNDAPRSARASANSRPQRAFGCMRKRRALRAIPPPRVAWT